jgi:NADPH-dependent 2,4-dienoyl-CoA reductase/sulfur reductase-like enzyme
MSLHHSQASEASDEADNGKEQVTSLKNTNLNVAIIGGGFAGLAAYKRLQSVGLAKLDLFEASDRLGGRVYPVPFGKFLQLFL